MANIIIVAVLVLIGLYAVISYRKKLTSGCCGGGADAVQQNKVEDTDPSHYPYEMTIGIDGMTCNNCKNRVENALNATEGIWAQVSLKDKSALVRMKKQLDADDLRVIVARAGYTFTGVR